MVWGIWLLCVGIIVTALNSINPLKWYNDYKFMRYLFWSIFKGYYH